MERLDIRQKLKTAKKFTELAIQNGLLETFSDGDLAAEQVCKFYQYIVENIDKSN